MKLSVSNVAERIGDGYIGGVISVANQLKISEKVVYAESNENLEWSLWRQRIGSGLTLTLGERKRVQSRLELM